MFKFKKRFLLPILGVCLFAICGMVAAQESELDLKVLEKSASQNKNLREKYLAKSELAKHYIENDDLKSAAKCLKDCADFDYLKSAK